ncbi:MAG: hypothetical protein WA020_15840 [Candidatus Acidiferrales bacterium]
MDILWTAIAICAMVSVAFYVLALSWQRMLRSHSRAIRELFDRLESLEAMDDPLMRRKIGELMPSPLEQVYILSFRLGERFWRDTLGANEQQVRHIHEHGTFIGSVKIEVWRSHAAITLRELLPQSKSAGWQTRTVDLYATDSAAPAVLWQLCLEPAANSRGTEPPLVELRYENGTIVLATRSGANRARPEGSHGESVDERIVFCIPLDAEQLAQFRVPEAKRETGGVESEPAAGPSEAGGQCADRWFASFSHQEERQGVDWQLRVRDLNSQTASGHWTIMEPPQVRRVS